MLRYTLKRVLFFAASLLGAIILTSFIAILANPEALTGSDVFFAVLGEKIAGTATFNLGLSSLTGISAMSEVAAQFASSGLLILLSLPIALMVGIPLAMAMADDETELFISPLFQIAGALPLFCLSLVLAALAKREGIAVHADPALVIAALATQNSDTIAQALGAFLPVGLAVGLTGAGAIAGFASSGLRRGLREPYRDGLRRLGLSESEALLYVARQAFAHVLIHAGDIALALFSAATIAEGFFDGQGAGSAFLRAVAFENWPVVAAIVFVIAVVRLAIDCVCTLGAWPLVKDEARL